MGFPRNLKTRAAILFFFLAVFWNGPGSGAGLPPAPEAVPLARYLEFARASADWTWLHYDELVERWKHGFDPDNVFGYRPPGGLLEMAVISGVLFETEKNPKYAQRAKTVLLTYGDYRGAYPESARAGRADYAAGVPALPDFFTVMRYIRAYDILRRGGALSADEDKRIQKVIAHSLDYLLRTQEWGPMNRAALRAESLAWAVRALPDHPRRETWEMQRRALGDDSWGNWQIEDATIYNGVWLYSLLGYAEALDKQAELFRTPEMYYYGQYYVHLLSPAGMVPDFGDAHWEANWAQYLVFFEAAAAAYHDPGLKWAAATIAGKFVDFDNVGNIGLAYMLLDACRWGTDSLRPAIPVSLSTEVMEDVQGKKIVFRNGWDPRSTYLLLNYRDEGDGGLNFRDYLRDTIPVEEEKMTHGHADENSLVLLMSGGSVLLHDGGYRDYMPSGPFGAYRQDYFHNRLCVRPEKIFMGQEKGGSRYSVRDAIPGQSVLDFLHNAGSYRKVWTQKVDFLTLEDFDFSRTRLRDDDWGYESDRLVIYLKEPEIFVVFDVFKARREGWFTLADLWHTQKILDRGDHWYRTSYATIQENVLSQDQDLLILFLPSRGAFEGVEPIRRHYQDELMIHQTVARHFELGGTAGLVTVLIPHPRDSSYRDWPGRVRSLPVAPGGAALAVAIESGGQTYYVGAKIDLRRDISRDWRRPRYTYDAGKVRYGDFETDGDLLVASLEQSGELDYTVVNLTKAVFRDRVLIAAEPSLFGLAFDSSPDGPGVGKLRYWRERVNLAR